MYELPTTITLEEKSFPIRNKGDFRVILDCFQVLEDLELTKEERVMASLIIFYDDIDDVSDFNKFPDICGAVKAMYNFFNCNQVNVGTTTHKSLVNWEDDEYLIISAINKVANKEVRACNYLHWWTFISYYLAIEDGLFSNVISIRSKISKGKKLEKYEQEFRRDNPQFFTSKANMIDQQEAMDILDSLWVD